MTSNIFKDFRKEYWFHVSNQEEISIYGDIDRNIDAARIYNIAKQIAKCEDDLACLKQIVKNDVDSLDTLRTIVGITDKRMYLELSYIFNKKRISEASEKNILGESVYSMKKHSISFFKGLIKREGPKGSSALDIVVNYLLDHGVVAILKALNKLNKREINSLVEGLLLPKEIQQEKTKRRGHGAEQKLAILLYKLGVSFMPEMKHISPMSQDDPNVDKINFNIAVRDEASTWSLDLIVTKENRPMIFVQGLIHTSDPGQYGVNKSAETVAVKEGLDKHNAAIAEKKELWGLVDGVGFIENPKHTIFKMLPCFDTFIQLKSLYKAALRLHKLGLVKIRAIKFDMSFYTIEEANNMFELYGSSDILKVIDSYVPSGEPIAAGKAWIYI